MKFPNVNGILSAVPLTAIVVSFAAGITIDIATGIFTGTSRDWALVSLGLAAGITLTSAGISLRCALGRSKKKTETEPIQPKSIKEAINDRETAARRFILHWLEQQGCPDSYIVLGRWLVELQQNQTTAEAIGGLQFRCIWVAQQIALGQFDARVRVEASESTAADWSWFYRLPLEPSQITNSAPIYQTCLYCTEGRCRIRPNVPEMDNICTQYRPTDYDPEKVIGGVCGKCQYFSHNSYLSCAVRPDGPDDFYQCPDHRAIKDVPT